MVALFGCNRAEMVPMPPELLMQLSSATSLIYWIEAFLLGVVGVVAHIFTYPFVMAPQLYVLSQFGIFSKIGEVGVVIGKSFGELLARCFGVRHLVEFFVSIFSSDGAVGVLCERHFLVSCRDRPLWYGREGSKTSVGRIISVLPVTQPVQYAASEHQGVSVFAGAD